MRSDRQWLYDMLQAINQIEEYTVEGKQTFEQNRLIQSAVMYQIIIIGESARAISEELQTQNPEVPWSAIVGMRNILVHEHFRINLELVWSIVERNLLELKVKIKAILQVEDKIYKNIGKLDKKLS